MDASASYVWSERYADYMTAAYREGFVLTQAHTTQLLVLPLKFGYRPPGAGAAGDHVVTLPGGGGGGGGGSAHRICPACPGHPDPTFFHTFAADPRTFLCVYASSPETGCGFTSTDPLLLLDHVRTHEGACMHGCAFCGAGFCWPEALLAHARLCGTVGWCGRRCDRMGHQGELDPGKEASAAMRREHADEQQVSYCGVANCTVGEHVRSSFEPLPTNAEQRRFTASHRLGGGEGESGGGRGTGVGEGGCGGGGGGGGGGAASVSTAGGAAGQVSAGAAAKRQKVGPPKCLGGYFGCTIPSHWQEGVRIEPKQVTAFAHFHECNPGLGSLTPP